MEILDRIIQQKQHREERIADTQREIEQLDKIILEYRRLREENYQQSLQKSKMEALLCSKGVNCKSCIYFGYCDYPCCNRTIPEGLVTKPTQEVCGDWTDTEPQEDAFSECENDCLEVCDES